MATAVILGGGISGLSTAYYLLRAHTKFTKVILLESSSRVGGWIQTVREDDGAIFEQGPRSMRTYGEGGVVALDMISELGLSKDVMPVESSHPASKNRYIYTDGQLHKLPSGPLGLLKKQRLFSKAPVWRILAEPFQGGGSLKDDVTLHSFVSRRLGREVADYVIDPVCRGIFAGDSKQLSLKSTFPALYNMAKQSGSLVRGALVKKKVPPPTRLTTLSQQAQKDKWVMWTMREGMTQISDSLHSYITADPRTDVRIENPCQGLKWLDSGAALVTTDSEEIRADHIFAAVRSTDLADMLTSSDGLYHGLKSIKAVSVVIVSLEYEGQVMPFQGFGHLLPSCEDRCMLGVIYDSCTATHHDRKHGDSTRFTCMFGGAWYDDLVQQSGQESTVEEHCKSLAVKAMRSQLGVTAEPTKIISTLNKGCIPQYTVGHAANLAGIRKHRHLRALPLTLLGSSYDGVSVADCILNSRRTTQTFIKH